MRRIDVMTSYLDIAGAALVTIFAFVVWPPLALLTAGAFALWASYAMTPRKSRDKS